MSKTFFNINNETFNLEIRDTITILEKNGHDINEVLDQYISPLMDNMKSESGYKVRHREACKSVFKTLIAFLKESYHGLCTPSLRTIACYLNPSFEPIVKGDSYAIQKKKDKIMNSSVQTIRLCVHTLEAQGFIKIHKYRADTNRARNENFAYEIVDIANYNYLNILIDQLLQAEELKNDEINIIDPENVDCYPVEAKRTAISFLIDNSNATPELFLAYLKQVVAGKKYKSEIVLNE